MIDMINVVFCAIILVLGIWGYGRKKNELALSIGAAFAFFGISHLIVMMGLGASMSTILFLIRLIAYVLVMLTLLKIIFSKK